MAWLVMTPAGQQVFSLALTPEPEPAPLHQEVLHSMHLLHHDFALLVSLFAQH
ncbi:hypothetical protein SynA1825c_00948 [Synechococcus sp. A18-25c]|nr:hypothetical protein SynA1825c_00948 [Synechococcus sp. A18-25c]